MKYALIITALSLSLSFKLLAQQNVSGIINDATGKPIPDVTISVIGTSIETRSDLSGYYSIEFPKKSKILRFKKTGYETRELTANKEKINLIMEFLLFDLFELSMKELLEIKVISASNTEEKLMEVPATMIVLSENDIRERGYQNLTEIFNDLPGMDIANFRGQIGLNNYWRGFRTYFSQPYLLMIDGLTQNETYYNHTGAIRNIPLSNIKKIEVVYGPVSSVYGANAFMGVINIITKKNNKEGLTTIANTSGSVDGHYIGDYYFAIQKDQLSVKLASRFEHSNLADMINFDAYEYSSHKYKMDTLLWSKKLVNSVFKKGQFESIQRYANVDLRLGYNNSEIGIQTDFRYDNWGTHNSTDRLLHNTPFYFNTYDLWFRQNVVFNKKFNSKICLLFRLEDLPKGDWIEGNNVTNKSLRDTLIGGDTVAPDETVRIIKYSFWPGRYKTYSFSQSFEIKPINKLTISAGIKYDIREITKQLGYYGTAYTVKNLSFETPDFIPERPTSYLNNENTFTWIDYGVYIQSRLFLSKNHIINSGIRFDNNSEYGSKTTIRGGYVGQYGNFGTKVLYGQAYQIPTPRTLYSTYPILGASTDLTPENSQTFELQLNYTSDNFTSWLSGYNVKNDNTIVSIAGGATNLGIRNIIGIDAHTNYVLPVDFLKKIQLWTYFSTYLKEEEELFDDNGVKTGIGNIGDLSKLKAYFGVTAYFTKKIMVNLRGRYIGERKTVSTNPLKKADAYFTMDANIIYKDVITDGFSIALKAINVFDKQYFHPGTGLADAGDEPSRWENGVWNGSQGWQESLLPQPHRYFYLSMILEL